MNGENNSYKNSINSQTNGTKTTSGTTNIGVGRANESRNALSIYRIRFRDDILTIATFYNIMTINTNKILFLNKTVAVESNARWTGKEWSDITGI